MADTINGRIKVPAELADSPTTLGTNATALNDELLALRPKIVALSDTWIGNAQTEYQGYQTMWDNAANGLFGPGGILDQIANAMGTVNENYFNAEWSNTSSWKH